MSPLWSLVLQGEHEALAPWLALVWLRLCMTLGEAEGWVGAWGAGHILAPWLAAARLALRRLPTGRAAEAAQALLQRVQGLLPPGLAASGVELAQRGGSWLGDSWDTVAMTVLVLALTYVLWRKRQVRRRQQGLGVSRAQPSPVNTPPPRQRRQLGTGQDPAPERGAAEDPQPQQEQQGERGQPAAQPT